MHQVDQGIFLHKRSWSDNSLIVTYFTKKTGLKNFVFRGGKKKASTIFPLAISEITYYGRKESDLPNLTKSELSIPLDFQFHPVRATIAFFIAEVVRKCLHSNESNEHDFMFLQQEIIRLDREENLSIYPLQFLIRFTEYLGFYPLIQENGATCFNLDEGYINSNKNDFSRVEEGEHVRFLVEIMQNKEARAERTVREQTMEMLLMYYRIHVPGFETLETYSIVKEILRD